MATRIRISTTFDCTTTGVTGHYKAAQLPFKDRADQLVDCEKMWIKSRNQQRNYETLMQLVNLYTQPLNSSDAVKQNATWNFEFEIEFDGVFATENDSLGLLKSAAVGVPVLCSLDSGAVVTELLQPDDNIFFNEVEINKT